jgi:hypothetical protein
MAEDPDVPTNKKAFVPLGEKPAIEPAFDAPAR